MLNPDFKSKHKLLASVSQPAEVDAICTEMLRSNFMVRCEIVEDEATGRSKYVNSTLTAKGYRQMKQPTPANKYVFEVEGKESRVRYFFNVVDGWASYKMFGAILSILAMCMYQVWPPIVRTGVWWIAVTFLLLTLIITILQLVIFMVCWPFGYSVWFVPGFWVENSPYKMFFPVYTIEKVSSGQMYLRLLMAVVLIAAGVWAYHAPTEVQALIDTQKQMVEDLYAGKLLGEPGSADFAVTAGGGRSGGFGAFNRGPHRYGWKPVKTMNLDEIERLLSEDEPKKSSASETTANEGEAASENAASSDGSEGSKSEEEAHAEMDAMLDRDEAAGEQPVVVDDSANVEGGGGGGNEL
jgi:hypothetical protein